VTKSDDLLSELEDSMSDYIKSVGAFQFENAEYTLVGHYRADDYLTCEICGHERIVDIYMIKDSAGKNWNVGNVCIDKLTNQNIKDWFANWKRKKDGIEKNRYWIDKVSAILELYKDEELPFYISKMGVDRLEKMLARMSNGLDPLEATGKLANYYIRKLDSS
jgi:hypothetical protein